MKPRTMRWALAVAAAFGISAGAEPEDEEASLPELELDTLLDSPEASAPAGPKLYREDDLESYFTSGPLLEAKRDFDRGRFRSARQLLVTLGTEPPVRYLSALSAYFAGELAAAERELTELAPEYPQMRDACLLLAGKAAERLGKGNDALARFGAVSEKSGAFAEAHFAMVRILGRRGDLDGAISAVQPLRDPPNAERRYAAWVKVDALLKIAELAEAKGDHNVRHRALLETWASVPLSDQAEFAWKELQGLPVPNKWRIARAEVLLAAHRNQEAARLASQVKTPLPEEWACRAGMVVGNSLRKERQHRKAILTLAPIAEKCAPLRPQAMFVMAYSQSVVDPPSGIATYDALQKEFPTSAYGDDALFFAAELAIRQGQLTTAQERLAKVVENYPQSRFASESLFQEAMLLRELGKTERALAVLDRVRSLQPPPESADLRRADYWSARMLTQLGDSSGRLELVKLADSHPTTYYGLLARWRTQQPGLVAGGRPPQKCTEAKAAAMDADRLAFDPSFLEGVERLRLGLPGASKALLAADRRQLPRSAAQLLISAIERTGDSLAAAKVTRVTLGRDLEGSIDHCGRPVWEAKYPRPWLPFVLRSATAAKLDPALLYALMREESAFRPTALSSTGALGLTQLMPATALSVARTIRIPDPDNDDLFRPSLNIRIGAAYLGGLVANARGSLPHAVASYNAGPEAVARWVKRWPKAEPEEWVELIPVEETRNYVKRVLGSYAAYSILYAANGSPTVAKAP